MQVVWSDTRLATRAFSNRRWDHMIYALPRVCIPYLLPQPHHNCNEELVLGATFKYTLIESASAV